MKKIYVLLLVALAQVVSFGAEEHLTATFESSIGTETTSIDVSIDTVEKKAHFIVSGPLDKYIGFGFGSTRMAGSYAFACNTTIGDGNVSERMFTGRNGGTELASSVENVTREEDEANNRVTIEFDRNTDGLTADYYSFDFTEDTEIDFIYSLGMARTFSFHGASNFGITKLAFAQVISGLNSSKKLTEVSMFPNPVQDVITLRLSGQTADVTVKVLDMKGTEILSREFTSGEELKLDVSTVNTGFYTLSVTRAGLRSGMAFQKL